MKNKNNIHNPDTIHMKKGKTEVIFLIDRSGSMGMGKSRKEVVSGFNNFIKEQKKIDGECYVSFYQFDDKFEHIFVGIPLAKVKEMTRKDFRPRGTTALYDAICKTINLEGLRFDSLPATEKPEKVFLLIITDGMENASVQFSKNDVMSMIRRQENEWNWSVVFLSSDLNAVDEAHDYISHGNVMKTDSIFEAMSTTSLFMQQARSENYGIRLEDSVKKGKKRDKPK